ncbi:MAG: hypothetical protein AAGK01_05505 [Pseudomonadota bacterium]
MSDQDPEQNDLLNRAELEVKAMWEQGMEHPSTQPVLIGAAIGFAIGIVLFDGAWFLTAFAGAAFALYNRLEK